MQKENEQSDCSLLQGKGGAFLVPRQLLSDQRILDFTWIPSTLDILEG
jgi:hypothetical protein